ncbi:MAG: DUF167 domain-containing protein [Synechococcus sp.]|nr:DUF167 domain-containing protein [Synechococcus sp.]
MAQAGLAIRVLPRSSCDAVAGQRDGVLVIKLRAAAVEGQANQALIQWLAKRLGVPRSAVHILKGDSSRQKLIGVDGFSSDTLLSALLQP